MHYVCLVICVRQFDFFDRCTLNLPLNRFPIFVLIFSFFETHLFHFVGTFVQPSHILQCTKKLAKYSKYFRLPAFFFWWLVKFTSSMKCIFSQQLAMSLLPPRLVNGLKTFFVLQIPKSLVFFYIRFFVECANSSGTYVSGRRGERLQESI